MLFRQRALLTFLAWLAMVGFDFLLHAGLLADFYTQPSPFLLAPDRAFALIPVGYASFFLQAVALVWLGSRLSIRRASSGFLLGLELGALIWGALVLGLASISTAPLSLLAGWFAGQSIELAIGGAVVGSALGGTRLRTVTVWVIAVVIGLVIMTVALQSFGVVPSMRLSSGLSQVAVDVGA